jgi:serine/threonine protein kinase
MPRREIAKDLPSFNYENVELREQIGHGAYGMVCKGKYNKFNNEVVVIKKLSGESANEENCFVKEARLMFSLNHENIVTFKAFSSFPCAIMMEYLCFNFSIFEIQKELNNLTDFLNFIDKVDALSYFPNNLMPKIAFEISKGLEHLHSKGIVHRDLKAKNILISNLHYCNLTSDEEKSKAFLERPVLCKLADFGGSRSHIIQTTAALHSRTRNDDRYIRLFFC